MKRIGILLLIVFALGLNGCAVGQKVALGGVVEITTVDGAALYPFSVSVIESRPFVLSGDKTPDFIGKYRALSGIPWDVCTEGNIPLATQMRNDLTTYLINSGFPVVTEGARRQVKVHIVNYNFDCYRSCRVWNRLHVIINNERGEKLYEHTVNINQVIKWSGSSCVYCVFFLESFLGATPEGLLEIAPVSVANQGN